MKLFKTVLSVLIIAGLLFSPLYGAQKSGTTVNMNNDSNKLVIFEFVRLDHGIPGYAHVPSVQHGGGINPKSTLTSTNKEPGKYGIRIYGSSAAQERYEFKKAFIIRSDVKEINIKLDPTSTEQIKFECDCTIKENLNKEYNYTVYEFLP
jgi:hypothetical protein